MIMRDSLTNNNGTVLIVDDTPGNLALLSDMLSEAQYRVLVATDGLTAIEQIQYIKPDIILLDVMMPGMDGFQTCNKLKSDPSTKTIPVLFMTGLSELDDLLRGFGEGALDYIVKPIRPAEVLARIEVHLTQNRNLRRAERMLADIEFAGLSVDKNGYIDWMTPAASSWLNDFTATQNGALPIKVGDTLPGLLLEWFLTYRNQDSKLIAKQNEPHNFTDFLSATIGTCEHPDKFLLLLLRNDHPNNWDPKFLRDKLKLTFREAEILMWISRGKTNKEIGIILNTSPRTVNKHLEHIFEKLGVCTRAAAVAIALETE
jgi:CheY-like chemotaxis protein/DNA-binding CsgD family transcriptional regulator